MEGTPFGRYQLLGMLGRGGMGEVWRAHDTVTERVVALKMLPPQFSDDAMFQQRFRREALAAARLNSPHVIPIYDYGEIDGRLFVSMRLIEGRDLHAVMSDGALPPSRAVRIIEQIAKALHAAHKVGLVHRDVKPSNVLLDDDDFAYLIDFGIARATDDTRLTGTGNAIGTFQYMAPERMGSSPDDARADVYALACVLYECLTGAPPFAGQTMAGLVASHLNTPPPLPSATKTDVPQRFDDVIATGMAKDPDHRYATTIELATAAHDAITTPLPAPQPAPSPPPEPELPNTEVDPAPLPPVIRQPSNPPPHDVDPAAETQHRRPAAPTRRAPGPPPQAREAKPDLPWWRRKPAIIGAAVTIVATVITIATIGLSGDDTAASRQTLPFTDLRDPTGVAVGTDNTVYIIDGYNSRVLKLAAGATTQAQLPFTGLSNPPGVAVDTGRTVYVADYSNNRVVKLAAGATTQIQLPFTGLSNPRGVAIGTDNTAYITDYSNNRVLKLAAGATTQIELPFSGLSNPRNVAVGNDNTVYITDNGNSRVLKLTAGATTQTQLPFTGLKYPGGVAIGPDNTVYVTDNGNGRVLKLTADSAS